MDKVEFTLDRFTRGLLLVITVLLSIIAFELWAQRPSTLPAASAQIPDSGLQRVHLIQEARETNKLLGQILEHMRTKAIKVHMSRTDEAEKSGGPETPGRRKNR